MPLAEPPYEPLHSWVFFLSARVAVVCFREVKALPVWLVPVKAHWYHLG